MYHIAALILDETFALADLIRTKEKRIEKITISISNLLDASLCESINMEIIDPYNFVQQYKLLFIRINLNKKKPIIK